MWNEFSVKISLLQYDNAFYVYRNRIRNIIVYLMLLVGFQWRWLFGLQTRKFVFVFVWRQKFTTYPFYEIVSLLQAIHCSKLTIEHSLGSVDLMKFQWISEKRENKCNKNSDTLHENCTNWLRCGWENIVEMSFNPTYCVRLSTRIILNKYRTILMCKQINRNGKLIIWNCAYCYFGGGVPSLSFASRYQTNARTPARPPTILLTYLRFDCCAFPCSVISHWISQQLLFAIFKKKKKNVILFSI